MSSTTKHLAGFLGILCECHGERYDYWSQQICFLHKLLMFITPWTQLVPVHDLDRNLCNANILHTNLTRCAFVRTFLFFELPKSDWVTEWAIQTWSFQNNQAITNAPHMSPLHQADHGYTLFDDHRLEVYSGPTYQNFRKFVILDTHRCAVRVASTWKMKTRKNEASMLHSKRRVCAA